MKKAVGFLKSATLAGVLIVLPLVLMVLLLIETLQLVEGVAAPVAEQLPFDDLGGIDVALLLALVIIVATFLVVGLAARSRQGQQLGRWLERRLMYPLPGYTLVKTLTTGLVDVDRPLKPVLIEVGPGIEEIGFLMEEHDGAATVFVPLAPTPTVGSVRFVQQSKLRKLDIAASTAVNCVMSWGLESTTIFAAGMKSQDEAPPGSQPHRATPDEDGGL